MYNLFVSGLKGKWDESPTTFPIGRVIREYTTEPLRKRLLPFNEEVASDLAKSIRVFLHMKVGLALLQDSDGFKGSATDQLRFKLLLNLIH
jgi:hypothetical protein